MPRPNPFVDHVLDLFDLLGPVRSRAMFGGHGFYLGETMFALIAEDRLYLKVDQLTKPRFIAVRSKPFLFRNEKSSSYYEAPAEAMNDSEAMLPWARLAVEAARRSRTVKRVGGRKKG